MKELIKWISVAGITLLGYTLYSWHEDAIQGVRDAVITEYTEQDAKAFEEQLSASQALFEATLNDYKQYATRINADNARLQLVISGLQKRPTRAEASKSVCNPTSSEGAGTGAGLYREDAEFLIGEAARASAVMAERDYYYSAYQRAREKLKELNGED